MTTYPILDNAGKRFAFEIENVYLTLSKAAALLRSVDGVSDIEQRRLFRRPMDVHVRFRYRGVPFIVWEPYADSSRYWIGPEDARAHPDVGDLQAAFDRYNPPFVLKALGYLVSLKFLVPARQK
jgi:hypothetical protein